MANRFVINEYPSGVERTNIKLTDQIQSGYGKVTWKKSGLVNQYIATHTSKIGTDPTLKIRRAFVNGLPIGTVYLVDKRSEDLIDYTKEPISKSYKTVSEIKLYQTYVNESDQSADDMGNSYRSVTIIGAKGDNINRHFNIRYSSASYCKFQGNLQYMLAEPAILYSRLAWADECCGGSGNATVNVATNVSAAWLALNPNKYASVTVSIKPKDNKPIKIHSIRVEYGNAFRTQGDNPASKITWQVLLDGVRYFYHERYIYDKTFASPPVFYKQF